MNEIPYTLFFWFFSELVGEILVNFQCKVPQVMESISFSLNDLYFVINPFESAGADRVGAVIENAISISVQHPGKGIYGAIV